jgi:WD40 repeat protein
LLLDKEPVVLEGRRAGQVLSVAFSPDGNTLAAAEFGKSRAIRLWDVKTGKEAAFIPGVKDDFRTVLFTPDGKQLIGCVANGAIRVWQVAEFPFQPESLCISFSPAPAAQN